MRVGVRGRPPARRLDEGRVDLVGRGSNVSRFRHLEPGWACAIDHGRRRCAGKRADQAHRHTSRCSPFHFHCPAAARYASRIALHPLGASTMLRIVSASRASMRCSSSTRVTPFASSTKRTSTSLATVSSTTNCELIRHDRTSRRGGSQTRTFPQLHSLPSTPFSYQRPPCRGSITASFISALPMWCDFGHQTSKRVVKTSKARPAGALTRIVLRTGAALILRSLIAFPFFRVFRLRRETLPAPRPRTCRARRATDPGPSDRFDKRAAFPQLPRARDRPL